MSKIWFILGILAMFSFVGYILNGIGSEAIKNIPDAPSPPSKPTGMWDTLSYPVDSIGYFFELMSVSSAYAWLGAIIVVFVIALIWAVVELIRGV